VVRAVEAVELGGLEVEGPGVEILEEVVVAPELMIPVPVSWTRSPTGWMLAMVKTPLPREAVMLGVNQARPLQMAQR